MNSDGRKAREKNPREGTNWVSLLTFFFALKIFRKKEIGPDDIYEIVHDFSSEKVGDLLERRWEDEENSSLIKVVAKMFWKPYLCLGLSMLTIETALMVAYPLLLGKLVSYFTPGQTSVTFNDALLYTGGILALCEVYTLYIHAYILLISELIFKIKIACCALIYRKCLKLSPNAMLDCPSGLALTVMTKDVLQFGALDFLLLIIVGVFQAAIMLFMMYQAIGVAALLGSSLLIVAFPLQGNKT